MNIKRVFKNHAYQDIPLSYEDAYELGGMAIESCAQGSDADEKPQMLRIQTIAALSALHNKATYAHQGDGRTTPASAADQIAGICSAVFEEDIGKSDFGFVRPDVPYVMDNCGMGGDLIVTANVSTIAALIASAAGIPMCKHGSPSNADEGRHGSSDFVLLCGIDPFISREDVERVVAQHCFGYTEALDVRFKRIHLQTHKYAGIPHMNDIIGPITNPVDPRLLTRRVLGVNHLIPPEVSAHAYRIMNEKGVTHMEHLIVVRGYTSLPGCGVDELSVCRGGTDIAVLRDGVVTTQHIDASDFGLVSVSDESISPPQGMSKGDFSLGILGGEIDGSPLQMVLANAALLFHLAHPEMDFRESYHAAQEIFSSGKVPCVVEAVREDLVAQAAA